MRSNSVNGQVLILAAEYPHFNKEKDGIFIKDQAMALNRHGIRADVAFVEPRSLRSLSIAACRESHFQTTAWDEDGVFTLRLKGWNPWMNSLAGGIAYAKMTAWLAGRYFKRYGHPELIHAQNTFWAGYAAYKLWEKYGIPYVVTEHSSRFLLNSITRQMAPYASRVLGSAESAIGVSRAVTDVLYRYGARKTTVIPNMVDTDFFTLPSYPRLRNPFTFVAVGNMNYNKGFDVLLRSFAARFRGYPGVRLVLGGDGPQRLEFQQLSLNLGLSAQVKFLGAVGRQEVRETLWKANALVLPSYRETFGVVLIEALATGIPVIASKCGGPEDIVTPDTGFLVEPGNESELVNAMVMLMERSFPEDWLRQVAIVNYSNASVVNRLNDIYQTILTGRQ